MSYASDHNFLCQKPSFTQPSTPSRARLRPASLLFSAYTSVPQDVFSGSLCRGSDPVLTASLASFINIPCLVVFPGRLLTFWVEGPYLLSAIMFSVLRVVVSDISKCMLVIELNKWYSGCCGLEMPLCTWWVHHACLWSFAVISEIMLMFLWKTMYSLFPTVVILLMRAIQGI